MKKQLILPITTSLFILLQFGCERKDKPELPATAPTTDHPEITSDCLTDDPECVDWRFVTDESGRALLFHGGNIDGEAKGPTGLPPDTTREELPIFAGNGFNFSRYLLFWSKVEPVAGEYNEAYLDDIEQWLDLHYQAGLTVVLDMHQDCWSEAVLYEGDGSNGAPDWATITDGQPHDQPEGFWSLCYLSSDINAAFDNFWDYEKHPELQDHYAAMWAHVIERFKDHPAVLGYDLMNEPWEGQYLPRQREFDETLFHDFNQRMINAIREVDPDGWIFFEPRAFGPNQSAPSWIPKLTDPRTGNQRLVYFPHFYPVAYESGYDPATDDYIETWQANRLIESETLQTPLIVGEWSNLPFNNDENLMYQYFDRMNTMLDDTTSGWAFWTRSLMYSSATTDGVQYLELLARPYPRAVAGQPISYSFDRTSGVFTLQFESRAKVSGSTEIHLAAERYYPDGYELQINDGDDSCCSVSYDNESGVLSITTDPAIAEYEIVVSPQ